MENSRFKFRAWHKASKKMYNVMELGFTYDNFEIGHICLDIPDNDDWELLENTDNCILMQYTGLKDKNGFLIFEGDVLQDGVGNIFEISFIKYCYYVHEIKRHHWSKLDEGHTSYEIIGNIYENPELLEDN